MNSNEMLKTIMTLSVFEKRDEINQILEEAYKKNYYPVIEYASKKTHLIQIPDIYRIVMNYILLKQNEVGKNILYILLNHNPEIVKTFNCPKLESICNKNAKLSATALLCKNTPPEIISSIILNNNLTNALESKFMTTNEDMSLQLQKSQNPIFVETIKILHQGIKWENNYSMIMLVTRLEFNVTDLFLNEVASCNLNKTVASILINAIIKNDTINNIGMPKHHRKILQNLNYNPFKDVQCVVFLDRTKNMPLQEYMDEITARIINPNSNEEDINSLWENLNYKREISHGALHSEILFTHTNSDNKNIMFTFAKKNINIAHKVIEEFIDWVTTIRNPEGIIIEDLIEFGLNNPNLKELILNIPKYVFDNIALTPEHRQIVEKKYDNKEHEKFKKETLDNIFSNKLNWYQKYSLTTDTLIQEAGWKENVSVLLSAMVLVLSGSTTKNIIDKIKDVSAKMKISEEQLTKALQNPEMRNKAIMEIYRIKSLKEMEEMEKINNPSGNTPKKYKTINNSETNTPKQINNPNLIKNIIARTIYAETLGEPLAGKLAVASVIYNRSKGNLENIINIIKTPLQFSCWNKASEKDWTNMKQKNGKEWEECIKIANDLVSGSFKPVINSDHYWNPEKANPYWAYYDKNVKSNPREYVQIGKHRFLNLEKYKTKG